MSRKQSLTPAKLANPGACKQPVCTVSGRHCANPYDPPVTRPALYCICTALAMEEVSKLCPGCKQALICIITISNVVQIHRVPAAGDWTTIPSRIGAGLMKIAPGL